MEENAKIKNASSPRVIVGKLLWVCFHICTVGIDLVPPRSDGENGGKHSKASDVVPGVQLVVAINSSSKNS